MNLFKIDHMYSHMRTYSNNQNDHVKQYLPALLSKSGRRAY